MATARLRGSLCDVRVTRDLADNWAVEIAPRLPRPRKWERFKPSPAPIVLKLHATSGEAAMRFGLELLRERGLIDDWGGTS